MGYEDILKEKDEYNNFVYSVADRNEIKVLKNEVVIRIKRLERERSLIEKQIKTKQASGAIIMREMKSLRTKRGKQAPIRVELEKKLSEFGIERPVYHGGEFEGTTIKVLFQKIDAILKSFKEVILAEDDRVAKDDEVNKMVDMFTDLGFILDGLFSLARTPSGKLDEEKTSLMKRFVDSALKLWRYLRFSMKGPKIHEVEDHMLKCMIKFKGIGCFVEDFVEQAHQIGVQEELRSKALNLRDVKYKAQSDWEWKSNIISVVKAKIEIKTKTSRKRKRTSEEAMNTKRMERKTNRMNSLLAVEGNKYNGALEDWKQMELELDNIVE